MAEAILVPQVGQDLTEATVVELHVKLGDMVKKGDLVAVVESEKASFEVEAFAEGVVVDLPYEVGERATVLEPLMLLGEPGEAAKVGSTKEAAARGGAAKSEAASGKTAPRGVSSEVGAPKAAESTPSASVEADASATPAFSPPPEAAAGAGPRSSPAARRAAEARGLDLSRLAGTGPRGAIVLRDIETPISAGGEVARAETPSGRGAIEVRLLQAGRGYPVVFLHGFGADLSSWRPMLKLLPADLPVRALDLPGHGGSAGHAAADFAEIVEAVGRALAAEGCGMHLVAHSLGAAVAAALTERGDLDIRSLTLISPAGFGASVDGAFVEGFLAARSETALAAWMRRLVGDPASLAPVLVRATLAARENPELLDAQARVARGVFEGSTQLFSVVDAVRRFHGPCTIIAGRDDSIIPYREVEAQAPANAAFHRLPGIGHLPQIEAAELVRTLIARTVRAAG